MPRIYIALLANAALIVGVILFQIWSNGAIGDALFFKTIGTAVTMGIFMSFVAVFRMDFAALESRALGYFIITAAGIIETMIVLAIWEIWVPNALFFKVIGTIGVLTGLAFYILSLKEDILRERRQKKEGYLD
jgi:hypothetical protein